MYNIEVGPEEPTSVLKLIEFTQHVYWVFLGLIKKKKTGKKIYNIFELQAHGASRDGQKPNW